MSLDTTTLEFIRERKLIARDDHLLVGLSGGADSVALVIVLSRLRTKIGFALSAVYLNHSIRKKASRTETNFCAELCQKLKVNFESSTIDVPNLSAASGDSLETAARNARRQALTEWAERLGANKIALGHHADDQVETILFRILRGTGPAGLAGMRVSNGNVIRPFLNFPKSDILEFLQAIGQDWCEDQSNRQLKFTRNRIRHRLLPQLRKEYNRQVDRALINLAELVESEHNLVMDQVIKAAAKLISRTPGGKLILDLKQLANYPEELRSGVLRHCLMDICGSELGPDRAVVVRTMKLIRKGKGRLSVPQAVLAEISHNRLFLHSPGSRKVETEVELPGQTRLEWPKVNLVTRMTRPATIETARSSKPSVAYVDHDEISPPLLVRTLKPGDRFRPIGMRGSKKVGDFLTDRKYPKPLRDEQLIVTDRKGIVWLVGQEIDDRCKIGSRTRKVLRLEYHLRNEE